MKDVKFEALTPAFLAGVSAGNVHTPTLYHHPNVVLREMFWLRLRVAHALIKKHARGDLRALDFGAGNGVFLPTLSKQFNEVVCLDLDAREAAEVVAQRGLANVEVVQEDMGKVDYAKAPFDVVVAADVLEHFIEPRLPIAAIANWVKPDGILVTSLPTENWVYEVLRRFFGMERPEDHYHNAYQVERMLEGKFTRLQRVELPLFSPIAPLFLVSVWRLV